MKKERKEDSFIKQPYYKGGDVALKNFVNTELKFPITSTKNKIEGHINLRYEINHKGNVSDVKIVSGLDEACNEEAIRVVKLLKFIVPKTPRSLKVAFHKTIRINFSLNNSGTELVEFPKNDSNTASSVQYQYSIIETSQDETMPKQSINYTYKVQF
jgi:TonB family protein